MKRVVITGVGAVSPMGPDVASLLSGIEQGRTAVQRMPWDEFTGLKSKVGAPAELVNEKAIPRQNRRSMGRLAIFAAQASTQAFADSGLPETFRGSGRMGCVIGSTMGSAISMYETFSSLVPVWKLDELTAGSFFRVVSHTAALNVAQYLGLTGSVLATSAACASGLQALGAGYDLIRLGEQDAMLCGGAEELHASVAGSFDILYATSCKYNDQPEKTPRPFDRDRDGLVCGDGSGIVLLEEMEHAKARGARIYAEVIGYHTSNSGSHVSESNGAAIAACIRQALQAAATDAKDVDYVGAHATGTLQGDGEEAFAIREIFGDRTPVSSLKGHIGHTLGASGPLELIVALDMMKKGVVYPTRNLENPADNCQGIAHVTQPTPRRVRVIVKNSFAFGGINATLVCREYQPA